MRLKSILSALTLTVALPFVMASSANAADVGGRHIVDEGGRHIVDEGGRHIVDEGGRHIVDEGGRYIVVVINGRDILVPVGFDDEGLDPDLSFKAGSSQY